MLMQRLMTALILGLLLVGGITYLPSHGFVVLVWFIILGALLEYFILWRTTYKYYCYFAALLIVCSGWILTNLAIVWPVLIVGVTWWLMALYFLWRYVADGDEYFKGNWLVQLTLGILMFVPCGVGLIAIYQKFGKELLWYLLILVWVTDTGAYFCGRFFGKHLLVPKVSPKKTREGLWGGILSALLVAIGGIFLLKCRMLNLDGLHGISFILLSLLASLWSVVGDLFESMLKRQARVKDSGKLLPGHGGIYDRLDSLLAAAPMFAIGILLMW